jgi:pyruvate kinase
MLDAGMDVARINFSEGDQKTHGESLENLTLALKQRPEKRCSIMLDTQGPEITLENIRDDKNIEITAGQTLKIVTDRAIDGDNQKVACSFAKLPMTVRVGSPLYIGGGLHCEITEAHDVSFI